MKANQKRERGRERKRNSGWSTKERRSVGKAYRRSTETKTQGKTRRRKGGKEYQRQRKGNSKRYPKSPVQRDYQRPNFQLKYYQRPKKKRERKKNEKGKTWTKDLEERKGLQK